MSFEVLPYSLISLWQMQSYQSEDERPRIKKKKQKKTHVLHKNTLPFKELEELPLFPLPLPCSLSLFL